MAQARLTPELAAGLAARLAGGVSVADAARAGGVHPKTLGKWLRRGRRESEGAYAALVAAVAASVSVREEEARARADEEIDEAEARLILSRLARGGSVAALRLYVERFLSLAPAEAPAGVAAVLLAEMDELAAARRKRGA